jgi:GT2 family glycosyltransferase
MPSFGRMPAGFDASVVIPTRDRPADLARVVAALARQETNRRFEVVVVDDASSPPLDEAILDGLAAGRVVRACGGGPAAARNLGVREVRSELVLFTDDDTEPQPRWVEAACEFLEAHPDHVAVEGPISSPPYDPLYEHSLVSRAPGAYWTCNMAYRRPVLERLGGFLEDFPDPHCEDLDLAYRAARLGPIGFAPDMRMVHFPRSLSLAGWARRARFTRSEAVLFSRHRERYGKAARIPPALFPIVSAVHNWRGLMSKEGRRLLSSPRRLARFLAVMGVYLFTVGVTTLRSARAGHQ